MADRSNVRLSPEVIAADRATLAAVTNLSDYAPVNSAYSIAAVQQIEAAMLTAQQAEERQRQEADVLREQVLNTTHSFHDAVRALKAQVVAQYGHDSVALHAVGLKKQSERKRPTRRPRQSE